jgi:hypothetical protein
MDMALLSVIRRWHLRDHLSIREIAQAHGFVAEHDPQISAFRQVEPQFKVPERPSKLDPFVERLSAWLRRELGQAAQAEAHDQAAACRSGEPRL